MISEEELNEYYEYGIMCSIGTLYYDHYESYEINKDIFIYKLRRWITDGKLLLGKDGVLLEGSIDEQLNLIRNSFPNPEDDTVCTKNWFYFDDSPVNNAVWILDEFIDVKGIEPYKDGKFLYWTA